jgi:hypothetical protein
MMSAQRSSAEVNTGCGTRWERVVATVRAILLHEIISYVSLEPTVDFTPVHRYSNSPADPKKLTESIMSLPFAASRECLSIFRSPLSSFDPGSSSRFPDRYNFNPPCRMTISGLSTAGIESASLTKLSACRYPRAARQVQRTASVYSAMIRTSQEVRGHCQPVQERC